MEHALSLPPLPAAEAVASLSVLVADDSRLQRRILAGSLRRWGYRVHEAASGDEALAICEAEQVDIVISDWMMPGMTGLDLCRAFRALPRAHYGYFILLTSKAEKGDIAEGLEIGADDFLSKPVTASELRARLRAGERILGMERELVAKNALLTETLEKMQMLNAALDRDLEEARRLQESLVPRRFLRAGGAEVALLLRPSGHLGGDLVGTIAAGPEEIGLYALDVSGHGIASALVAARLASHLSGGPGQNVALRTDAAGRVRLAEPGEVARRLNRLVLEGIGTDHYLTLALARVDLRSGEVRLVQAGHPHPAVLRADGRVEYLGDGGLPVGLLPEAGYGDVETILSPGDRLILHSDGLTECPDPRGRQLGEAGLARLMRRSAGLATDRFFDALVWDLGAHAGEDEFEDDISAVMLDYRPEARRAAKARSPELPSTDGASDKSSQKAV